MKFVVQRASRAGSVRTASAERASELSRRRRSITWHRRRPPRRRREPRLQAIGGGGRRGAIRGTRNSRNLWGRLSHWRACAAPPCRSFLDPSGTWFSRSAEKGGDPGGERSPPGERKHIHQHASCPRRLDRMRARYFGAPKRWRNPVRLIVKSSWSWNCASVSLGFSTALYQAAYRRPRKRQPGNTAKDRTSFPRRY